MFNFEEVKPSVWVASMNDHRSFLICQIVGSKRQEVIAKAWLMWRQGLSAAETYVFDEVFK